VTLPVFVIHWNAPEMLADTVASLRSSQGVDPDVTVIDNASDVAPPEELSSGVRLDRLEENIGFAGAANIAVATAQEAEAPWFAIAAHDVLVEPDALEELVGCLRADPKVGVVAPVLLLSDRTEVAAIGGEWLGPAPTIADIRQGHGRLFERRWLHGCLLLIRTECVAGIGGFRSELFAYYEDVDLCFRARDAGWRIGVWSGAVARERGTTSSTVRKVYLITRNRLVITRRREGSAAFLRESARVGSYAVRAFVGGLAPWRSPARREVSREHFRGQLWGLVDGVLGRLGPGREFAGSR
jgi:N-acetylglucosaminyl-diphospho-decaprenol L-rhamnosyltransferase